MKASQFHLIAAALLLAVGMPTLQAAPRAAEASGAHYLIAAESLEHWHLGGYYRYQERELKGVDTLKQSKAMMHLGRDIFPWLAIYGVVGSSQAKLEHGWGGYSDSALEYGGGAWLNLLDHDILGNLMLESRLRLQALGQISRSSPEINGTDTSYTEFYGNLTLSIVNELIGNKSIWPDAIALFVGPVYNHIESNKLDEKGSSVGLIGGLDFYITKGVTMSLSYEHYFDNKDALNAALSFRF